MSSASSSGSAEKREISKSAPQRSTAIFALSFLILSIMSLICASTLPAWSLTDLSSEAEFVETVFVEMLWQKEAATIAADQAASQAVKSFAHHMTGHYDLALKRLRIDAQRQRIGLQSQLKTIHVNTLEHIRQQQGAALDREYMVLMTGELGRNLALFRSQLKGLEDRRSTGLAGELMLLFEGDMGLAERILSKLPYSGYKAPSSGAGP